MKIKSLSQWIIRTLLMLILAGNMLSIPVQQASAKPLLAPLTDCAMQTQIPRGECEALNISDAQPQYRSGFIPMKVTAPDCVSGNLIQSIEANDEFKVTFTLCRPDASFLSRIAMQAFAIYPQEWIVATSGPDYRASHALKHPIGTGPYEASQWDRGNSIIFTKNPDYWGAVPEADTLIFRWNSDPGARLLELQNGTIDGFDNVAADDVATIEADSGLQLHYRPALNTFYIGMNNTLVPFDNQKVRQAIAMGIDRQHIVDTYYPYGSELASHFTPCSIPNGCVGDSWYTQNLNTAENLLTEAGYPSGFTTNLYYRNVLRGYLPQVDAIAQEIHNQLLANLGINAIVVELESSEFIQRAQAGTLNGFYLLGWGADYPHVSNFLDYHFGQNNQQFGDPFPAIYYQLNEALQYADPATAAPYYMAANNAIRDLVPMVPVAHSGSAVAYLVDVTNPQSSPLTNELFAVSDPGGRNEFRWMQGYEPASLFCADETDGESFRACAQVMQSLYAYEVNGSAVEPSLATSCVPNANLTTWVCSLRQGVKFHDGTDFDANDVVATFAMGLDESSVTHKGNSNSWDYYTFMFGLINTFSPSVNAITRANTNPTSAPEVNFAVTFSEPVTGVDVIGPEFDNFALTAESGVNGASITSVDGSGATYTVTVNTGNGNGVIRLDMPVSATIMDMEGNLLTNLPFMGGRGYDIVKGSTFSSTAAKDGWVLETNETSNQGGTKDIVSLLRVGDDARNRQYRSILYFDTSNIPRNMAISKVILQIKKAGVAGTDPFSTHGSLIADMKTGFFGLSPLEVTDFNATAAPISTAGKFKDIGGDWYQLTLSPANFKYINLGGVTQFRLRFTKDDDNDKKADFISFYAGDNGTNPPQLIVEYTMP